MESLEIAVKNYNATVNFVMRAVKRVTLRVRSSVIHVPRDFPTISAAVTAASAGDTILVQRGVYRESVTIPSSKSHIRIIANGTPVILDGGNNLGTGFTMMADHVEIQGFTIRDFKRAGIRGASVFGSRIIRNRFFRYLAKQNSRESQEWRVADKACAWQSDSPQQFEWQCAVWY